MLVQTGRSASRSPTGTLLASKLTPLNHPKVDEIFRKEYSQLEKSNMLSGLSEWTDDCGMFPIDPGQNRPYLEDSVPHLLKGGEAESVESYRSCVVVGCRCLLVERFGKNEDLDGFLEPVNLFVQSLFNPCVCWTPVFVFLC